MIATPDRRLRVFVSSTLEELAPERAAARVAIESLRLTPVLFELGARPHPPRDLYRAYVEQSDIFVGIYGERYGWVSPELDVSGLEDECELGREMPRLLYVKHPAPNREERLRALIERIEADADVSYKRFADADELRTLIEDDLALLLTERFDARRTRAAHTRLPAAVDTFVGRERELAELERHLTARDSRLVTITGPGGVGKTRLGLEAARRAQGSFADGAAFVPISALVDHRLVGDAIRESLELPAASGSGAVDVVTRGLAEAELLLVLDNFEQVLAAGPDLGAILERCPGVVALVTSRAVLKLKGEHEFPVRPLEVADEAVELFVARARAANRGFTLDDDDQAVVRELCRRLDGLPLAIEIAAGHVRLLRPRAILDRLDQVKAGEAGAGYPDRQQTLRATIEWSVALLAKPQQTAFARAGVFRSTFGLDAFEAVCAPEGTHDGLEWLGSLVEGSLLRAEEEATDREPRFSMLETIRAYAAEQLEASGEAKDARGHHASFYLELVAQLGAELRKSGHDVALMRLQADENNIRAALEWALSRGDHERVAEAALALTPFWTFRERTAEGRRVVRQLIDATAVSRHALARALAVESVLAYWEGDFASAFAPATEANAIFRELGDKEGIALTLFPLGMMASMAGDVGHSRALLEESHAIFDRVADDWGTSLAKLALAWALNIAGADAPRGLYEEAIERAQSLGYEPETLAIGALGRRRALEGNVGAARRLLGEALRRVVVLDAKLGVSVYVDLLSDLAANTREDGLATRLAGAAEASFAALGVPISPVVGDRDARLRGLRGRLGEAFEAEYEEGKSLTLDAAVEQALGWAERG